MDKISNERGEINVDELAKKYEEIKNEDVDVAFRRLAKEVDQFINTAAQVETVDEFAKHMNAMVCAITGGILFPDGIKYTWQADAVRSAWEASKQVVAEEIWRRTDERKKTV